MERTKAIVKFFSQEPIENVMVMMKYMPERVIFLGHKDNMITKQIRDIEQFRDHKYPDVELEFIEVPKDDLDNIIGTLAGIIREYPGIRFALTGGSEMLLIALGCISARMEVSKLRIDPFTGKEIDVRGSKVITSDYHFNISIAEDIMLHGGLLTKETGSISEWKFTDQFREDIRIMWDLCRRYRGDWNKHCGVIDELRKNTPNQREGWSELYINMRTDHRIREQVTFPRRYLIDMQLQHVSCLCDNLLDLIILEPKHHFFPVFFVILEHANLIQIPQQTDGIAKLIDV